MGLLTWIFCGLVCGLFAQLAIPRRDLAGFALIVVFGVQGAVLGGCTGALLDWGSVTTPELRGLGLSMLGAFLFLAGQIGWMAFEFRRLAIRRFVQER